MSIIYADNARKIGLNEIFSFGRYRNSTLRTVINEDSEYIEWLIKKLGFTLDDEAYELFQLVTDSRYHGNG